MSHIVASAIAFLVLCSPSVAAEIEGVKWQPGHYFQVVHKNDNSFESVKKWLKAEPKFRGATITVHWRDFEKSRARKYDFSLIDRYIDIVSQTDDYVFFGLSDRAFSGTCASNPVVPNDMTSWGQYAMRSGQGRGCLSRIWDPKVSDRYIALIKAFADRYDNHPRVVGINYSESAGNRSPDPTFSVAGKKRELIRIHQEVSKFMKHTIGGQSINFFGNPRNLYDLAEVISKTGIGGLTGPDMVPCRYYGTCVPSKTPVDSYPVFEKYKGKVPILPEGDAGGLKLGETKEVIKLVVDVFGANMKFWKTWHPDSSTFFQDEVIPTLKKEKWRINTACPTSFEACFTDGGIVASEPPAPTGLTLQVKDSSGT